MGFSFSPGSFFGLPSISQTYLGLKEAKKDREAQRDANAQNVASARASEEWSSSEADKQMEFQERMSSSAHQREVDDLRKAGLNPLLSANAGADSPGGAAGSGFPGHVEPLPSEFRGAGANVASSRDSMRLWYDVQSMKAAAKKANAEGDLAGMESAYAKQNPRAYFMSKFGTADTATAGLASWLMDALPRAKKGLLDYRGRVEKDEKDWQLRNRSLPWYERSNR